METLDVVIETPAGSRTKYAWDPKAKRFRAKTVMPLGTTFPFDFGFVPDTEASDGDPLDVLVLADAPLGIGVIVECRLLGVFEIEQSEKGDPSGTLVRNDRLLAVPTESQRGALWTAIDDVGAPLLDQIEGFFRGYVERQGRRFHALRRGGPDRARELVREAGT